MQSRQKTNTINNFRQSKPNYKLININKYVVNDMYNMKHSQTLVNALFLHFKIQLNFEHPLNVVLPFVCSLLISILQ